MENTISVKEFKAWLEGYSEAFLYKVCPSSEQWGKIREKISTIADDSFGNTSLPVPWVGYVPPSPVGEFNPGGLAVAQDVKTPVKDAPVGPGYI